MYVYLKNCEDIRRFTQGFWIILLLSCSMSSPPPGPPRDEPPDNENLNSMQSVICDPPASSPYTDPAVSSPYKDPAVSSPYKDPAVSSPYKDPAVSSPYKDLVSSPYKDPVSSPYKDPVSSPYKDPVSSPYKDPVSSPYKDPVSSPAYEDPVSSTSEDPVSSPYHDPALSPELDCPKASDDEGPATKRQKYDKTPEQQDAHSNVYLPSASSSKNWPQEHHQLLECLQDDDHDELPEQNAPSSDVHWTSAGSPAKDLFQEQCLQDDDHPDKLPAENASSGMPFSLSNTCAEETTPRTDLSFGVSSSDSDSSSYNSSSKSSSSDSSSSSASTSSSDSSDFDSSDPDSDPEHNSDGDSDNDSNSENVPHYSKKLYKGSEKSVDEGVLSIMNLFMKKKLEKSLVKDILLQNLQLLPKDNLMPKSQYLLFKYVRDLCPLSPPKIHFYCKKCQYYLGIEQPVACKLCKSEIFCKFIQIPLFDQIKNLFELQNLAEKIDKFVSDHRESSVEGKYSDLCDGSEFKRVWCGGPYDLVLLGYSDGVSLSGSSDVQFHPLEFIICRIPYHLRFKFVLTSGIWVDESKPLMNTYLLPFAEELNELHKNGVKWTHPKSKEEMTSRISVAGFCADAPVRAQFQNISQHGGRHCCNICEQKMVSCKCEVTQEKKRVFEMKEKESCLRTAERMEKQGKKTRNLKKTGRKNVKPCKGVKGKSVVTQIPNCDRSTAVYPEYMHIFLGIVKQFLRLWFKTKRQDPWSLKDYENQISSLLQEIKVPDYLRGSRSLEYYPKWKASECRSFLLFFSLVVLFAFMKEKYFQHWLLLVTAMHILLQDSVMESDITKAEILLRMFLRDFPELYRAQDFTYNMHNLSHMGLTVRRYGPLPFNSAFPFENLNGDLDKCIHGTKNHAAELTNTLNLFLGIQVLKARVEALNVCPETLVERESIKFCSDMEKSKLSVRMRTALSSSDLPSPHRLFYRAVIKGETYTCVNYARQVEKNNFTICYVNAQKIKKYGEINFFCESSDGKKMAFVNLFTVEHLRTFRHVEAQIVVKHIIPIKLSTTVDLVPVENIVCKVIRVADYVCLQPNKVEVNF